MTETAQPISHFEVIVVGGGMVGAALGALVGQAGVAVALLDARPEPLAADEVGKGQPAMRVSALTPVSQRLLERLAVWPWMAARRVTPYRYMQVWDSEGSGEVNFSAEQAGVPLLGHIVENDVVLAALERRLDELPTVTVQLGSRVNALHEAAEGCVVELDDGRRLSAPLVVAADGARSPLREMAGIAVRARETGHVAVVTTVHTELEHGGVARQVFRESGPLAFLPLTVEGDSRFCSIVWSTSPEEAERLTALAPEALAHELQTAFEARLGAVTVVDRALAVPLTQRHAECYTKPGFALVGDAAHSIHPLAGQGVNLGLMDVAVLAEELVSARQRGIGLGEPRILERYARRRRGDNAAMLALMDGFRLLFGTPNPLVTLTRNLGLSGVDRLVPIKRLLMCQAIGERGRLPASCR
ncbi:UbiH/UbiF/VisC/COQ6 family ubiquinone biosynthesis hydroxylase [Billgrantia kenyensis]|uniref:UbiH/UbiF/VisC/COQ6 family ubiquinone biosynthesis hydroxylase n=1 Tax=Billgrantia kenyensis TaxID=321266 RepID=A0A7V9VYY7_9GAMM|nr:UbiH/UbiF/VisC/COQ6 family ubiquinone biosynthesis hydroxylase [Halomonas kenyensis]MBA2777902.1 UbiH/UbiF/VisC/COQ6 family ubiquinone biosynthesis hydroxylase [Halomonas kenyensis]MCG6661373.1 UbiH/UbiF/VisC/COQ6 family ubiquinone biosynthesis hydroxylase [Halomonas kenyensis]